MISIFKINIDEIDSVTFSEEYGKLSETEKKRVDSLKNYDDKRRSLAGKILLRNGIKKLYGKEDYCITYSEKGKPILPFCFFSISHSEKIAVCAISDSAVGIDVEKIKEVKKKELYHFFTKEESDYVNSGAEDSDFRFLEIWTRKEAYLKCFEKSSASLSEISVLKENNGCVLTTENDGDYIISVCKKNF